MLRKRVYDPARGGATEACPEWYFAADKWCSCTSEFLLDNCEKGFTIDLPGTENDCNIEIRRKHHDKLKECVEIALCGLDSTRRSVYSANNSNNNGSGVGIGKSIAAFAVIYADNASEHSVIARITLNLKERNEQGQKLARETVRKAKYLCPKAIFFGIEKLLIVVRQEYAHDSDSEEFFNEPEEETEQFALQPCAPDVVLALGDARIQAHKALLTAASPVFTAMFRSQLLESQTNVIQIPPLCDLATLKTFLACIYNPHVSFLNRDKVMEIFASISGEQPPASSSIASSSSTSSTANADAEEDKDDGTTSKKKRRVETQEQRDEEGVEGLDFQGELEGEEASEDDPPWMSKKELVKEKERGEEEEEENNTSVDIDMQTITNEVLPLLKIAHYYQTTPLLRRIEQKMLKTLYPETLPLYYEAATTYQLDRLVRSCATLVGDMLYCHCRSQSVNASSDDAWHAKLLPFVVEFLRRNHSSPQSPTQAIASDSTTAQMD